MNEAQRSVLQRHLKTLGDNIMLTEELLAAMYQRKLFEWNMIETIKAEKTHTDQLYKMLNMLPRRGPEAFDNFIDILKPDYPWLASALESTYKEMDLSLPRQGSMVCVCTCGSLSARESGPLTSRGDTQVDGPYPLPKPLPDIPADTDVKAKVGMFIHKQFGHSKRVSQQDKKSMERWLAEQIQQERRTRSSKPCSVSEEPDMSEKEAITGPVSVADHIHDDLKKIFNKVKDENLSDLLNSEYAHKNAISDSGAGAESGSDEIDANINQNIVDIGKFAEKLEDEIDMLINRMNEMEGLLTQCHYILGDPDRKRRITDLVKDVQYTAKQSEKELRKEKSKSEKMLNELYDYSKQINKLEMKRELMRQENEKLTEEREKLKRENAVIRDKCDKLEVASLQHLEKEKTLQNLKKMVDELKANQFQSTDDSPNFRGIGNTRTNTKRTPRVQNRKGSTVDLSVPGTVRSRTQARGQLFNTRKRTIPINRFN
ncbi:uncharacterized protein LOC128205661 [Mya arenaria]|uniref:uncharacterized protein LOC128205661 n=1 Tax=Mya arenaria TaxID=6604 RepID=UPI0022E5A66A|nr:uncharacterized protein LOC128205661 [Mya arenaria]XP_052763435.1 uncharacterized protein LOC128205661 [Mya arenaria]